MELTDAQWRVLEPLIPTPKERSDGRGRPWKPARLVLDGIVWILKTGAPWRYLPDCYPSYKTCHRRFQQWVKDGTILRILVRLANDLHVGTGRESFIDGTYAGAKKGGVVSGALGPVAQLKSWLSRTVAAFPWQSRLQKGPDTMWH
jgi:transposase